MPLESLTSQTLNDLMGPNAVNTVIENFNSATEALTISDNARVKRDAIAMEGAADIVTLEKERQLMQADSATQQMAELDTMAAALNRSREIEDSFWLRQVEGIATVFSIDDYSRPLLREKIEHSQQSIKLDDARVTLQTTKIDGRAREVAAGLQQAEATYIAAQGGFASATQKLALNRAQIADVSTRQQVMLQGTDAELASAVKDGFLEASQVKDEMTRRQNSDYQLQSNQRAKFIGDINVRHAALGEMTMAQLTSPATAKLYGAQTISNAVDTLNNQQMTSQNLRMAYQQNRLASAATTFSQKEIADSKDFTPSEKITIEQNRLAAQSKGVENEVSLRENLVKANAAAVRPVLDRLSAPQLQQLAEQVIAKGGSMTMNNDEGTPITFTSELIAPALKLRNDSIMEAATSMTNSQATHSVVNQALQEAGRAAGVGSIAMDGVPPEDNINAIIELGKAQIGSEATKKFGEAAAKFKTASNPEFAAMTKMRMDLESQGAALIAEGKAEVRKARLARTEDALKPATEDFMTNGVVSTAENALQVVSRSALNGAAISNPIYHKVNRFMHDKVQEKLGSMTMSAKATAEDQQRLSTNILAAMVTGKQKPLDLAGSVSRDQGVMNQAGMMILNEVQVRSHVAAAKALGMGELATHIESATLFPNKEFDSRYILNAVKKIKGDDPNAVPQYLAALHEASKEAATLTKPVGEGDLTIAGWNRWLLGGDPEGMARDAVRQDTLKSLQRLQAEHSTPGMNSVLNRQLDIGM